MARVCEEAVRGALPHPPAPLLPRYAPITHTHNPTQTHSPDPTDEDHTRRMAEVRIGSSMA